PRASQVHTEHPGHRLPVHLIRVTALGLVSRVPSIRRSPSVHRTAPLRSPAEGVRRLPLCVMKDKGAVKANYLTSRER
ncbi:MAG: hypothetical protein M3Q29_13020, partial [Chloroflexota bacterium]|nr:hypothetical protein [Chloroflexota bacterium]